MSTFLPSHGTKQRAVVAALALTVLGSPCAALANGRKPAPKADEKPAAATTAAAQPGTPAAEKPREDVPPMQQSAPTPSGSQAPQSDLKVSPAQASQQDLTAPTPLIQFHDVPQTRVGVDMNNVMRLTLHDAVLMAFNKNLDIESSRYDVRTTEYDLFAARGVYDPNVSGTVAFTSATTPVTSIFAGGGTTGSFNRKTVQYDATFSRLLEHGGSFRGSFNNSRTSTSATNSTLTPVYQPSINVDFTQPLLRNFDIDLNRRNILIAKKNLDISDLEFRQRVIATITSVQNAYWDLVYALRNEQIQREAVQLARVQLENNLKQVEAGTLAPIELRSTEADLESRKQQVITAMQQITTAENSLKNLMLADPGDVNWTARILPSDPATLVPVGTDVDSAMRAALVNRPELESLKYQTQLREIDLKYFQNQTKPQVDLIASYGTQGTAGTPVINPVTGEPIANVPERFVGGYFRSLGTLFSNDFRTYSVGVQFSFPIHNTIAEANVGRTQAELRQLEVQQRRQVQGIQVEIRNALQAVDAARQRYEAATAARVAAEAQLRGEEERFRAGLSTNFFVLDRQNQLSAARGQEAAALTDYNKAIVELQRTTGTTIVANNVVVK